MLRVPRDLSRTCEVGGRGRPAGLPQQGRGRALDGSAARGAHRAGGLGDKDERERSKRGRIGGPACARAHGACRREHDLAAHPQTVASRAGEGRGEERRGEQRSHTQIYLLSEHAHATSQIQIFRLHHQESRMMKHLRLEYILVEASSTRDKTGASTQTHKKEQTSEAATNSSSQLFMFHQGQGSPASHLPS